MFEHVFECIVTPRSLSQPPPGAWGRNPEVSPLLRPLPCCDERSTPPRRREGSGNRLLRRRPPRARGRCRARRGVRPGRPAPRHRDDHRQPAGDGERLEDVHRSRRDAPRGAGPARSLDHRTAGPGHRPPAHRRRRHGRAPALPPVRHRRLPRRGRARQRGLPDACLGAPAGDDRRLPPDPRRLPDEVPGGRALLLLQRRLRRARPDRGARRRPLLPRPGARAGLLPRRDVDTDFLRSDALPGTRGTRLRRGRRPVADQRLPPAGGRDRRRRHVHDDRRHVAVLGRP